MDAFHSNFALCNQVTIEASHSAPREAEAGHKNVQSEHGSATRFGDTFLHLLITKKNNDLAMKILSKHMSLLKARNNKLETPLHCAAKVGNEHVIHDLIGLAPGVVRDVLGETNENGETALHVAAKHKHGGVVTEFMKLDTEAAYKENKQGFSPFYIAIAEGYSTSLVKAMLEVDPILACTQFSDGAFPVHVAARRGKTDLVVHFLHEYRGYAALLDPCGRNLFHMAAEQEDEEGFTGVFALTKNGSAQISEMVESMINAEDYEGNTPLHVAAMKGNRSVMKAIWEKLAHNLQAVTLQNRQGQTAFDLSVIQLTNTTDHEVFFY